MIKIDVSEKNEMITQAYSKDLQRDHSRMNLNTRKLASSGRYAISDYLVFVTSANAMIGNKRKKFVKIEGKKFKI